MSRSSPRNPKIFRTITCQECNQEFTSFRKTARFCSKKCCMSAYHRTQDTNKRYSTLEKHQNQCYYCDLQHPDVRMTVRFDFRLKTIVPLCPMHNGLLSMELFRLNHPDAEPGYSKRVQLERKLQREAQTNEHNLSSRDSV